MSKTKVIKCHRCRRRFRPGSADADRWNQTWTQGWATDEWTCPDCQTPEENLEAEIKAATLDYGKRRIDDEGRSILPAKGSITEAEVGVLRPDPDDHTTQVCIIRNDDRLKVGLFPHTDPRIPRWMLAEDIADMAERQLRNYGTAVAGTATPGVSVLVKEEYVTPDVVSIELIPGKHEGKDIDCAIVHVHPEADGELLTGLRPDVADAARKELYGGGAHQD